MKFRNVVLVSLIYIIFILLIALSVLGNVDTVLRTVSSLFADSSKETMIAITLILLLFIGLLAINVVALIRSSINYKKIYRDVSKLSQGQTNLEKPSSDAASVVGIWKNLNKIGQTMEGFKYNANNSLEIINRFIPKNLEKFMDKKSLQDIRLDEINHFGGTMAVIHPMKKLDKFKLITILEEYEKKQNGLMLINNDSYERIDMVFKKGNISNTKRFLELSSSVVGDKLFTFLYYDEFELKIIGTDTKLIPSLTSENNKIMQEMAKWFESLALKLVISEDVKKREEFSSSLRCLGFVKIRGEKKYFYEVLDANPEAVRKVRMNNLEEFNNALELMYSRDFYLARTAFSEILKEDVTDELSRWYLFICEKCLNGMDGLDYECELDPTIS